MTNEQLHQFWVLLDQAGQIPTVIDRELGQARAGNPPVNENSHIIRAHNATAALGNALEALASWGKGVVASEVVQAPTEPSKPPSVDIPSRLTGAQLTTILHYTRTGSFDLSAASLRDQLGSNFNWYVNAYSVGGVYYDPRAH